MKNQALYNIIFEDSSHFEGGNDPFNTKWSEIPNKKIKRIFYLLPSGDYLCLSDYEKYNRITEATTDLSGSLKGKTIIRHVYFMGLKNGIVTSYRVSIFNGKSDKDKFRKGDITCRQYKFGKELRNASTTGWK